MRKVTHEKIYIVKMAVYKRTHTHALKYTHTRAPVRAHMHSDTVHHILNEMKISQLC